MYISKGTKVGDYVVTTKRHESMSGIFTRGSLVKVVDVDPIRGYSIEDENGNRMIEIGFTI